MKIAGLVKNSFVDYPKKISCVIFLAGCNMNCWYCHNAHINKPNVNEIAENEILEFLHVHKNFLDGIVISGGEPTIHFDLEEFITKIKETANLPIKLDTNGTNFEILKTLVEKKLINYVAMDIKAPFNKYEEITKYSNLNDIKKSINYLLENKIEYEFRTTFSPDLNIFDIEEISKTIKGAKNFYIQNCRLENTNKPLDENFLFKAKKIAKKYIQNVDIRGI